MARCLKAGICVPKVIFVDEKSGVLALEKVDGWSIREILGGGAEGEVEDDGEGDYVEPDQARAVVEELEGVKSEGLEALERIGVTKGESSVVLAIKSETRLEVSVLSQGFDYQFQASMGGPVNEERGSFGLELI